MIEGTVLFNRFKLIKRVGAGSGGMVFSCTDRASGNTTVAIKMLANADANDHVTDEILQREWEATQRITHPNVVVARGFFKTRRRKAFAMEYIEGGTLRDVLEQEGPLAIERAMSFLLQLSLGLRAIHAADIIHRDLKPENILVGAGDTLKISDFSISLRSSSASGFRHEDIAGTPTYLSPEYIQHGEIDQRSDIYALGVIAYEMIAGEPPFNVSNPLEILRLKVQRDPEQVRTLRKECPATLNMIVTRAMARRPLERYQTIGELVSDLVEVFKSLKSSQQADQGQTMLWS